MGNGRRGDQTYRGNSVYGRRFHQNFQMISKSMDNEESSDRGDQMQ